MAEGGASVPGASGTKLGPVTLLVSAAKRLVSFTDRVKV